MGGIVEAIAKALGLASEWLGFQSKKLDLKNADDVKAAAKAQDEATRTDQTKQAIAKNDLDELRKEISE
jgi:predicted TPR repeat methyltransferase